MVIVSGYFSVMYAALFRIQGKSPTILNVNCLLLLSLMGYKNVKISQTPTEGQRDGTRVQLIRSMFATKLTSLFMVVRNGCLAQV